MKNIQVSYHDYPSIPEIEAFIFFGFITTLVKPISPIFSFWDLDSKDVEIQETSKDIIDALCETNSYVEVQSECPVLKLTFDTGEVLNLTPDVGEESLTYYWTLKK